MSESIDNCLALVGAAKNSALEGIAIYKGGFEPIRDLVKVFKLILDVKDVAQAAPSVMPELKDLDAGEVGQLGSAVYSAVKEVYDAVKAA